METQRAYFGVFEFEGDPSVVTEAIGLEPTNCWAKGDRHPSGRGKRTHSRWEFGVVETASFHKQIEHLLSVLEQRADSVLAAAKRWEAGICCVGTYETEYNPDLHLSANVICRIAALGLSVDFDLYFLGQPDGTL